MGQRLYCHDFEEFACCSSCHSEWDDGYGDQMETRIPEWGIVAVGCCTFGDWLSNQLMIAALAKIKEMGGEDERTTKPLS